MNDLQTKKILEYLQNKQYATIEKMSADFLVSPSTIRRRLDELQKKELITRTHGGAKINATNDFFPSFTFRSHENALEKKSIALSAIKLIKNGDFIFLDGSTSSFFIAEYLNEFSNISVMTNGIDTLSLLSKNGINAYSTGGKISSANRSVLVGQHAVDAVSRFHADIVFFSARSVQRNGNIYDCFEEENFVRTAMMKNSDTKVFLCDKTKFGNTSKYYLCSVKDVDKLITDQDVNGYFEA